MTLVILATIAIICLTAGCIGVRLWQSHRVFGFLIGLLFALILCDIAIRVIIGKSLSFHIKQLADKLRAGKQTIPKHQP